jgi:hypothetical protein
MSLWRRRVVVAVDMPTASNEGWPVIFRPGVAIPLLGFLFAIACIVAAVILATVAHAGRHAPMPPPGDWRAIGDRLLAGEVLVFGAWFMYKVGSQRIVLRAASMEIITWGLRWVVGRREVADVVLLPASLTVRLTDGSTIRPSMFWSSGPGMLYLQLGLFRNSMSRETIREKILEWREKPVPASPGSGLEALTHRHWQVRANLWLLLGLAAAIAIEEAAVTAWW